MTEKELISQTMEWLNEIYGAIEVRGKIFKAGELLYEFERLLFLDAMNEYAECKKSGVV